MVGIVHLPTPSVPKKICGEKNPEDQMSLRIVADF